MTDLKLDLNILNIMGGWHPFWGRFGNHQIHQECHECIHQFIHVGTFILLLEFAGSRCLEHKMTVTKNSPKWWCKMVL